MPKLSRKDDKNTKGGKIIKGADTVFADKKQVGLHISGITPHDPKPKEKPHKSAKTTEGSPTVFVEKKPVLYLGAGNDCKHKIVEGSETVFVQGS